MRKSIIDIIKNVITIEYALPNKKGIDRSAYTSTKDICFSHDCDESIAKIIYNNIVEYAVNEYNLNYADLNKEQLLALQTNIRYDDDDSDTAKLKYGFFGEVLLYSILYCKFDANVLISKGYFYNPLEKSEAKGYDAFHLIQRKRGLELWFGEAKFYKAFKKPIKDVIHNLPKALSDSYFNNNVLAIIKEKIHISHGRELIDEVEQAWRSNPSINISEELRNRHIQFVYPVFIAYQKSANKSYDENIKQCIDYIEELFHSQPALSTSLDVKLFFMFLPVDDVKAIKKEVLEWIATKEPLI